MSETPSGPKVDLSQVLTPVLYEHLLQTIRMALPPPPDDTPEAWADRDSRALADIASLNPANYVEVTFALHIVVLSAYADDCFRLAQDPSLSTSMSVKWHAQGDAMVRQSQSTLKQLLREQKRRQKAKPVPKSARSEEAERRCIAMMEKAFAEIQQADRAEAERRAVEQRLSTVPLCFIHQPGDPKVLN